MRTAVLASEANHPLGSTMRQLLADALDPQGPTVASFEQAENMLLRVRPQALAVLLSPHLDRALTAVGKARQQAGVPILAVGPITDAKIILRALHEGASHYLDEDDLPKQFETALPRLRAGAVAAKLQAGNEARTPGHTIGVLASSGGCGASTIAVNLAVVLALECGRCGLVDLKPGVGDLAALLDLKPAHTLADLCLHPDRIDEAMLEKAIAAHSSGVRLLAPPQRFEDIRMVTPAGIQKVLGLARDSFPFVVIDQEDSYHEEQVMALRQADTILLVARLDFTSLRNTRRILDHLGQMNISRDRIRLVVNRHGQAKELPKEEVEATLQVKLTHFIPEDPGSVNAANNTGVPVVQKAPSSKAAQALVRLGKSLVPAAAPAMPVLPAPSKSKVLRWLAPFL